MHRVVPDLTGRNAGSLLSVYHSRSRYTRHVCASDGFSCLKENHFIPNLVLRWLFKGALLPAIAFLSTLQPCKPKGRGTTPASP